MFESRFLSPMNRIVLEEKGSVRDVTISQVSAKHMKCRSFSIDTKFTKSLLRFRSVRVRTLLVKIINSELSSLSFELVVFSSIWTFLHLLPCLPSWLQGFEFKVF